MLARLFGGGRGGLLLMALNAGHRTARKLFSARGSQRPSNRCASIGCDHRWNVSCWKLSSAFLASQIAFVSRGNFKVTFVSLDCRQIATVESRQQMAFRSCTDLFGSFTSGTISKVPKSFQASSLPCKTLELIGKLSTRSLFWKL